MPPNFLALLCACLTGWAIKLQLIRCGGVILEPLIALDCQVAGGHIEDYVPEPATIVLVAKRHQGLKVFLQMPGVIGERFVLRVCVVFAVETLHFLGGAIVPISIEMNCYKSHACFRKLVAFGKNGGFGNLLLWA